MLATLEGTQHLLLIGLGDGQLISYFLQEMQGKITVSSHKKVFLGTQSISLSAFSNASHGNCCIFTSGDRPACEFWHNHRLYIRYVILEHVSLLFLAWLELLIFDS